MGKGGPLTECHYPYRIFWARLQNTIYVYIIAILNCKCGAAVYNKVYNKVNKRQSERERYEKGDGKGKIFHISSRPFILLKCT